MPVEPVDNSWPLNKSILIAETLLLVGILIGGVFGYLLARDHGYNLASEKVAEALSKPLNLQVGLTNNSAAPVPGGKLLGALEGAAAAAVQAAESTVTDKAKLPAVAAEEFVKSVGEESGKQLVDGFSDLISSGFKPSPDKDEDRQQLIQFFFQNPVRPPRPDSSGRLPSPGMKARIVFSIGKAALTLSANATIDRARNFARDNPGCIILLTANADTLGSERKNLDLAGQRSSAVRERLLRAGGIAADRVFVADLGNTSLPIVTPANNAEEQNRSVTIDVRE